MARGKQSKPGDKSIQLQLFQLDEPPPETEEGLPALAEPGQALQPLELPAVEVVEAEEPGEPEAPLTHEQEDEKEAERKAKYKLIQEARLAALKKVRGKK